MDWIVHYVTTIYKYYVVNCDQRRQLPKQVSDSLREFDLRGPWKLRGILGIWPMEQELCSILGFIFWIKKFFRATTRATMLLHSSHDPLAQSSIKANHIIKFIYDTELFVNQNSDT